MSLIRALSTTSLNSFLLPPRAGGITAAYLSATAFTVDSAIGINIGDRFRITGGPGRYGVVADISGLTITAESIVDSSGLSQTLTILMTKVYLGFSLDAGSPINVAQRISSMAQLRKLTVVNGKRVIRNYHTTSGDGGQLEFEGKTGAALSTYVDNNGTIAVKSGGDGSAAWVAVITDTIYVPWFGVKRDVTDDTVACQSAVTAAAGRKLDWGSGTYSVSSLTGVSNTEWISSGFGACIIKARSALTDDFIKFSSKTNFSIRGITIDYNNVGTTGTLSTIGLLLCTDFSLDECYIKSFTKIGIGMNGCSRWTIARNKIEKDVTATALNQAILVTTSSGAVDNGKIHLNRVINSGIILQGTSLQVTKNEISGWGYGAGVSTGQNTSTSNVVTIRGNLIYNSNNALDADALPPQGIENWSRFAVITDNIVYACAGNGIFNGAKHSVIKGNVCFDNGKYVAVPNNGIALGYFDATYNSDFSIVSGNRCLDQLGVAGTQIYGIAASASLTRLTIGLNEVSGNKTAGYNLPCSGVEFHGNNILFSFTFDAVSVAVGAQTSTAQTVAGAEMGDFVQVSCSINLVGMGATAYVNAVNTVTMLLFNTTGGAIDLASATYRFLITKPSK